MPKGIPTLNQFHPKCQVCGKQIKQCRNLQGVFWRHLKAAKDGHKPKTLDVTNYEGKYDTPSVITGYTAGLNWAIGERAESNIVLPVSENPPSRLASIVQKIKRVEIAIDDLFSMVANDDDVNPSANCLME